MRSPHIPKVIRLSEVQFNNGKKVLEQTQFFREYNVLTPFHTYRGALRIQEGHSDWGSTVREILRDGIQKPKKGHDAGDHPPITPMRCADRGQLDHDSWRLYEYITKHFIGTVSIVAHILFVYLFYFGFSIDVCCHDLIS